MEPLKVLKYVNDKNPDMPTISVMFTVVMGEKLNYRKLSTEEFYDLIKYQEAFKSQLDVETVEVARQVFYNNTKKYLPNKYYVPVGFDWKKYLIFDPETNNVTASQVIEREDLKDNTIVMIYENSMTFPAYRNQEGKIEVINPELLLVCEFEE